MNTHLQRIALTIVVSLITLVIAFIFCLAMDFLFGSLSWRTIDFYTPFMMAAGALVACVLLWDDLVPFGQSETE